MEQNINMKMKRRGRSMIRDFIETPVKSGKIRHSENLGNVFSSVFGRFLL
jgi:hypothetical protein